MQQTGMATGPIAPGCRQARPGDAAAWRVAACAALLLACDGGPAIPQLPVAALEVERVDWSQPVPAGIALGKVAALAEAGDDVALFADNGVFLWSSGGTVGNDGTVQAWRTAAAVPSLGLPGQWLLGVDDNGRLYHVQTGASFGVQDVTDRYLLTDKPVLEVAATGSGRVVFVLAAALAVTDGMTLQQYAVTLRHLAGGPSQVAGYDAAGAEIFDPQSGALQTLPLSGVVGIAFAPDGQLWAATATTLYCQQAGQLVAMHQLDPSLMATGLAGGGRGVWVGLGDTLALVRSGQLWLAQSSLGLPAGAQLIGSPSGDAWVLSPDDGQLSRYGEPAGGGFDLVLWRQNMLPIFTSLCQSCHLPAGSAGLDLSTYSAWATRRDRISARVVEQEPSPMPPANAGTLTQAQLDAVKAWVARMP